MSEASDPFESSKMTFGEHLEELRGALLRSAGGLLLGFLIALLLAPTVVQWIEYPLKTALRRHYLAVAKGKLEAGGDEFDAPERWAAIDQLQMVPKTMYVDREQLRQQLGMEPSSAEEDSSFYRPTDIRSKSCQRIASAILQSANGKQRDFEAAIWDALPVEQRQAMERTATEPTSPSSRQAIANVLNAAIANPALHQSNVFGSLKKLFEEPEQRDLIADLREKLETDFSAISSQRLNRQLIDAVFSGHVRSYRPALRELTVWQPVDTSVQALGVVEPFMIYIKAALVLGLILSSPWVFFQIWDFVAAGMYPHEKKFVYRFLPFSIGLFLLGTAVAFCFVFEPVLDFLFQFNRQLNISAEPRISDWIGFVLILPLGFGLSFQLPLVMLLMERLGITTIELYLRNWRIAVLVVFILSMFLTPADPMSMLLMAVPLTILYFGGILLCKYAPAIRPEERSRELQTT